MIIITTQANPKPKHRRRRMELSIRFRFRSTQAKDPQPRPLMIRLTMDGTTTTDYVTDVVVRPDKWHQKNQMVTGRTKTADQLNERLDEIQARHRDILREMKRRFVRGEGPRPTADLVRAEFTRPGSTTPTLSGFFSDYIRFLDSQTGTEDEKADKTRQRLVKTGKYLAEFEERSPLLSDLTTAWGKRFHVWLQIVPATGRRRMSKDTANKYLSHVRDCLSHAVDEGYLPRNVLSDYRPKRGKTKPVYFLGPEQIERLLQIKTEDRQLNHVLWWSKLMIRTGLDYVDAIRFAREPGEYIRANESGTKIIIDRSKPPRSICEIPVLEGVAHCLKVLFDEYPEGPPAPLLADINRHLKIIGPAIGMREKLTSKILRKTAGALFLRESYSMEAVSRILGHGSIRVTIQHYVSITSSYMDAEMKRVKARQ